MFSKQKCRYPHRVFALVALIVCTTLQTQDLLADPIDEGIAALGASDYSGALQHFRAAVSGEEGATAFFYLGVTYNRSGQALPALRSLERAAEMGLAHPELPFEQGWALLRAHRYQEAVGELQAYEAAAPGRAQTVEFLGRAYLSLGQYPQAQAALQQAQERDPALAPTVRAALILLARAQERTEESSAQIDLLLREHPDDPLAHAMGQLRPSLTPKAAAPSARKWRLDLDANLGHNTNVIAIGDGIPLPVDISDEGSLTAMLGGRFFYDLLQAPGQRLVASYSGQIDRYKSELSGRNLFNHNASATYLQRRDEKTLLSVRGAVEYTLLDGEAFRTRVGLQPAVRRQVGAETSLELSYQFNHNAYDYSASPAANRDGSSHGLGLEVRTPVEQISADVRAGYTLTLNNASGPDFDYSAHTLYISAAAPLPNDIDLQAFYAHTATGYSEKNSSTFFTRKRDDGSHILRLRAKRPLTTAIDLHLTWSHVNNGSNIAVFDYSQSLMLLGVEYRR